MKKCQTWINDQSISRFWSSFIVGNDSCNTTYDYRGAYDPTLANVLEIVEILLQDGIRFQDCFYQATQNVLILFEKIGRYSQHMSVQTITIGTTRENANEQRKHLAILSKKTCHL